MPNETRNETTGTSPHQPLDPLGDNDGLNDPAAEIAHGILNATNVFGAAEAASGVIQNVENGQSVGSAIENALENNNLNAGGGIIGGIEGIIGDIPKIP